MHDIAWLALSRRRACCDRIWTVSLPPFGAHIQWPPNSSNWHIVSASPCTPRSYQNKRGDPAAGHMPDDALIESPNKRDVLELNQVVDKFSQGVSHAMRLTQHEEPERPLLLGQQSTLKHLLSGSRRPRRTIHKIAGHSPIPRGERIDYRLGYSRRSRFRPFHAGHSIPLKT